MTPAARVQAAIEILDGVIAAARSGGAPADRIAAEWFRARRFAGSKDRRAIRELVWSAIRACGDIPPSGRAAMLRLAEVDTAIAPLFDGSGYGPAPVAEGEGAASGGVAPAWLVDALAASGVDEAERAALLDRAPLDIRVNRLKADRDALAAELAHPAERLTAPDGLRFAAGTPVESWPQFDEGLFEVQDGGSQLACAALAAAPGEKVIDLCAGAGGKTLSLAASMENNGSLLACDIDRTRLSRLQPRAARAGAIVETRLLDPGREPEMLADWQGRADAVLVDAPCSGTGTWRRNPEARWRLSPKTLDRHVAAQRGVLDVAQALVAPGGRLTYIVCSLLDAEGTDQIAWFLDSHPGWKVLPSLLAAGRPHGPGTRLTPCHDGTDGFFFATLQRL
ncbi:RsmB/NOP family class I SAM-dependent RNA methyltransferase [Novosphingobium sp. ZN18A2]|uniref:RsmB/NOP family class I SAM-dependent RNA methyltransferase n=1 Tax=Novosphingobium sp. ZN18A2 TaxID=3079861 RepID=UPI0030D11070